MQTKTNDSNEARVWVTCHVPVMFAGSRPIHPRRFDISKTAGTTDVNIHVRLAQDEARFWLNLNEVPLKPLIEAVIEGFVLGQRLDDEQGPLWQFQPLRSPGPRIEPGRVAMPPACTQFVASRGSGLLLFLQGEMEMTALAREITGNAVVELVLKRATTALGLRLPSKALLEALIGIEVIELVRERSSGAYEVRLPDGLVDVPTRRVAS